MANVTIGRAKYGGQQKKYWKLKDGEATFRILPPLGELAEDGKWSIFYKVHYGYTNAEKKSRPFQSSLLINRQNKMVESPDAALERIDKFKAQLDAAIKGNDKRTKDALLQFVGGPKSKYNLDGNHYMNAMDLQNNIGVLKLRHKAKLALDLSIKGLRDKGVDPLSVDNGRFFVFARSGTALETTFAVSVLKKTIQVDGVGEVQQDVVHKLTEDVLSRLGDEAAELHKLFKKPTAEQVAQIVAESDVKTGISPNIDDILGFKKNGNAASGGGGATEPEPEYEDTPGDDDAAVEAAKPVQEAAPAPVAAKVETKVETKQVAVVETAKEAKVAAKAEAKAPVANAPQTSAEKVADMSDDEFLASLGLN